MGKFIAGAILYVVIVWILIVVPLLIAGIAMLIIGIKDIKTSKKKNKKIVGPIICTVIGSIFFIISSTAILAPTIWWIQYYDEAVEADKSYNKRFYSSSEYPEESEEVNSEEVYLIY